MTPLMTYPLNAAIEATVRTKSSNNKYNLRFSHSMLNEVLHILNGDV